REDIMFEKHAVRLLDDLTVRAACCNSGSSLQYLIVPEGDVTCEGPRVLIALAARRDEKEEPRLRPGPMVSEDIRFNEGTLAVLKLKKVLDAPCLACIGGVPRSPGQRLVEEVVADLDVRRHVTCAGRRCAPERDILAGALQIVIDQLQWSRRIPGDRGLRVGAGGVEVR